MFARYKIYLNIKKSIQWENKYTLMLNDLLFVYLDFNFLTFLGLHVLIWQDMLVGKLVKMI